MRTAEHDRAARQIAATRFPFPGQQDWPDDYVTLVNLDDQVRGVPWEGGVDYPDIVIVDGNGEIREIGEVETSVSDAAGERWARVSRACDAKTATGVRHFFVYVPPGQESAAADMLERRGISFAGLRTWTVDSNGDVTVIPVVTPGDPKDHR